jgi:hypothetical protein
MFCAVSQKFGGGIKARSTTSCPFWTIEIPPPQDNRKYSIDPAGFSDK